LRPFGDVISSSKTVSSALEYSLSDHLHMDAPLSSQQLESLDLLNRTHQDLAEPKAGTAKAIVYFLIRSSKLSNLKRALRLFHTNFNARSRYPVLFFHEAEFSLEHKEELMEFLSTLETTKQCREIIQCDTANITLFGAGSSIEDSLISGSPWTAPYCQRLSVEFCVSWSVIFASLSFQRHFQNASVKFREECAPGSILCDQLRFMSLVHSHPLLSSFDWYWRLDEDSEVFSVPYDPFLLLERLNKSFGWTLLSRGAESQRNILHYVNQYSKRMWEQGLPIAGFNVSALLLSPPPPTGTHCFLSFLFSPSFRNR
jgi:hypothetical protein